MALMVTNIPWAGEHADPTSEIAKRLSLQPRDISATLLLKRSVDGRRRPPVWLANYRVELVDLSLEQATLSHNIHGVRAFNERDAQRFLHQTTRRGEAFEIQPLPWPQSVRPIVIGAGPAGLFAALRLGEAGAPAILIDRGGPVEDRHVAVRQFWRHRELDPETNVVYGEGGAGAFSDGKIYTRRRDGELGWIFQRLVDFGADPGILEEGWAHLGTDRIREILPRLRARLTELGVEVRFHTQVTDVLVHEGTCIGVQLADGDLLRGGPVIMATGHSARDTWEMMIRAGAAAVVRPIRIGARVEHPQKLIDAARYGQPRGELPPASYRLVSRPKRQGLRGAHTFCMCPGGTVVGASNQPGRVVVNGMSYSGRRAWWANSAIIVEVLPDDYGGTDPMAGVRFQDQIEQAAFQMGGEDFRAPAQRVEDFLKKRDTAELPRNSYPQGCVPGDLNDLFPAPIARGLAEALRFFNRKIPGFAGAEGVLIAPETRTTAPLRFLRDDALFSTTIDDLMPVGEGAGYAGGITSAALDGFRAAQSIIARAQR
ncbi:MAG: FAD-dependent protein [Myxococcota bacterium]